MSTLVAQQKAFLEIAFSRAPQNAIENAANYIDQYWPRGLKVYLANGHAAAEAALLSAYPVLTQLLGQESLHDLACDFWHAQPPARGDMAQWGVGLAEFVQNTPQLAGEPYLPDLIRLEWALHQSLSAPNPQPDHASLALLVEQDPAQLRLKLSKPCFMIESSWPVVSIVQVHLDGTPANSPVFEGLAQKLKDGVAETAIVWRMGLQPRFRRVMPGEKNFVERLQLGSSLESALSNTPELDFQTWLPRAYQDQLLLAVEPLNTQLEARAKP